MYYACFMVHFSISCTDSHIDRVLVKGLFRDLEYLWW